MSAQSNFKNEKLDTEQSFTFVYDGPSFRSGIKINKLIGNLESIKELIYAITEVNLENKTGYNKKDDIQIKVIPKSGSIVEEIIVIFSNPEVSSVVLSIIVGALFYLLGRKDSNDAEKRQAKRINELEELIVRNQGRNIRNIYQPLEKQRDTLKIIEAGVPKLEIEFEETPTLDKAIDKMEKGLEIEEFFEEHEGYISAINVDTDNLKFHSKGMDTAYPLSFDVPMSKLIPLIATPIKAKLKVRKIKDKIKSFHLIGYKVLQKSLNEKE